jgi:hypothetical protein
MTLPPVLARLLADLRSLGGLGTSGVALLLVAFVLQWALIAPLEEREARLQARLEGLKVDPGGARGEAIRETPERRLAAFHALFPRLDGVPDQLARLSAAAEARGIVLQSGEYRVEKDEGAALVRYRATLPISGTYAQIRRFVRDVLEAVPTASLDELTLQRDSIGNPRVNARLRFTFWVRGD